MFHVVRPQIARREQLHQIGPCGIGRRNFRGGHSPGHGSHPQFFGFADHGRVHVGRHHVRCTGSFRCQYLLLVQHRTGPHGQITMALAQSFYGLRRLCKTSLVRLVKGDLHDPDTTGIKRIAGFQQFFTI